MFGKHKDRVYFVSSVVLTGAFLSLDMFVLAAIVAADFYARSRQLNLRS